MAQEVVCDGFLLKRSATLAVRMQLCRVSLALQRAMSIACNHSAISEA